MMVAMAAFGEHRELNQADAANIEADRQVGGGSAQQPGMGRVENPFSVWIRSTTPDDAAVSLKGAVDIVEQWVADGLKPEELERTKAHLQGRISQWAEEPGQRLAWALEAQVMGWPSTMDTLSTDIGALTTDAVNGVIQTHIDPKRLRIVVVTEDADAFEEAINGAEPTPLDTSAGAPGTDPALAVEDAHISGLSLEIGEVNRIAAAGVFR
jgi:hypothetical protein